MTHRQYTSQTLTATWSVCTTPLFCSGSLYVIYLSALTSPHLSLRIHLSTSISPHSPLHIYLSALTFPHLSLLSVTEMQLSLKPSPPSRDTSLNNSTAADQSSAADEAESWRQLEQVLTTVYEPGIPSLALPVSLIAAVYF